MKKWKTPKLMILYRGKPDEVLTLDCKHPSTPVGPAEADLSCQEIRNGCKQCAAQNNKS